MDFGHPFDRSHFKELQPERDASLVVTALTVSRGQFRSVVKKCTDTFVDDLNAKRDNRYQKDLTQMRESKKRKHIEIEPFDRFDARRGKRAKVAISEPIGNSLLTPPRTPLRAMPNYGDTFRVKETGRAPVVSYPFSSRSPIRQNQSSNRSHSRPVQTLKIKHKNSSEEHFFRPFHLQNEKFKPPAFHQTSPQRRKQSSSNLHLGNLFDQKDADDDQFMSDRYQTDNVFDLTTDADGLGSVESQRLYALLNSLKKVNVMNPRRALSAFDADRSEKRSLSIVASSDAILTSFRSSGSVCTMTTHIWKVSGEPFFVVRTASNFVLHISTLPSTGRTFQIFPAQNAIRLLLQIEDITPLPKYGLSHPDNLTACDPTLTTVPLQLNLPLSQCRLSQPQFSKQNSVWVCNGDSGMIKNVVDVLICGSKKHRTNISKRLGHGTAIFQYKPATFNVNQRRGFQAKYSLQLPFEKKIFEILTQTSEDALNSPFREGFWLTEKGQLLRLRMSAVLDDTPNLKHFCQLDRSDEIERTFPTVDTLPDKNPHYHHGELWAVRWPNTAHWEICLMYRLGKTGDIISFVDWQIKERDENGRGKAFWRLNDIKGSISKGDIKLVTHLQRNRLSAKAPLVSVEIH